MNAYGPPHQALFFVLAYLPLRQLLSLSQVCKSFRDVICNDVLIWLDVVVERPLNAHLTDEILMMVTSKAQGRLRTLALLNCFKITDDGLLRVINENPLINKLYVTACTGLTPEGVLTALKTLAERGENSLTRLKINGIYNLKPESLLALKSFLPKHTEGKPRFYHQYRNSFSSIDEEDWPIDVEKCQKCKEVKLVFDCPRNTCRTRVEKMGNECKGCFQCIQRCDGCGRCISDADDEQEETICNDVVCLNCWLHLPKCNLCNKPFCPQHAGEQLHPPDTEGFVCDVCQTRYDTDTFDLQSD